MAAEDLLPAARRHLEGRFLVGLHPMDCHTYTVETEPREEDPEGDGAIAFYFEREEVRSHALMCLDSFVSLAERSLELVPSEADVPGAADYRLKVGELFGFINLAIEGQGAPTPGAGPRPGSGAEAASREEG